MPRKNKVKNAFYFFLKDFKQRFQVNGELQLQEIAHDAGLAWNEMTRAEKQVYEDMARNHRSTIDPKGNKADIKYNSLGVPIKEQQRLVSEKETLEKKIAKYIEVHVSTLSTLGRYCDIPTGYAGTAKDVAEKTHGIHRPRGPRSQMDIPRPHCEYDALQPMTFDASLVYSNMLQFLARQAVTEILIDPDVIEEFIQPMYVPNMERELVIDCIGAIMAEAELLKSINLRVYPLENLLYNLIKYSSKNETLETLASRKIDGGISLAEQELAKDKFCFSPDIACAFHEEVDKRQFCSRSKVKRWGYIISDFVCRHFDVELVPTQHCPAHALLSHFEDTRHLFNHFVPNFNEEPANDVVLLQEENERKAVLEEIVSNVKLQEQPFPSWLQPKISRRMNLEEWMFLPHASQSKLKERGQVHTRVGAKNITQLNSSTAASSVQDSMNDRDDRTKYALLKKLPSPCSSISHASLASLQIPTAGLSQSRGVTSLGTSDMDLDSLRSTTPIQLDNQQKTFPQLNPHQFHVMESFSHRPVSNNVYDSNDDEYIQRVSSFSLETQAERMYRMRHMPNNRNVLAQLNSLVVPLHSDIDADRDYHPDEETGGEDNSQQNFGERLAANFAKLHFNK